MNRIMTSICSNSGTPLLIVRRRYREILTARTGEIEFRERIWVSFRAFLLQISWYAFLSQHMVPSEIWLGLQFHVTKSLSVPKNQCSYNYWSLTFTFVSETNQALLVGWSRGWSELLNHCINILARNDWPLASYPGSFSATSSLPLRRLVLPPWKREELKVMKLTIFCTDANIYNTVLAPGTIPLSVTNGQL